MPLIHFCAAAPAPVTSPGKQAAISSDGQDAGGAGSFGDVLARLQPAPETPAPSTARSAAPSRRHNASDKDDTDASAPDAAGLPALALAPLERQPTPAPGRLSAKAAEDAQGMDGLAPSGQTPAMARTAAAATTALPWQSALAPADGGQVPTDGIEKSGRAVPGLSPASASATTAASALDGVVRAPSDTGAQTQRALPGASDTPPVGSALSPARHEAQAPARLRASGPTAASASASASATLATAGLKAETGTPAVLDTQTQATASAAAAQARTSDAPASLVPPAMAVATAVSAYEGPSYASNKALEHYRIQSGTSSQRGARIGAPSSPSLTAAPPVADPAATQTAQATLGSDLRTPSNADARTPTHALPGASAATLAASAPNPVPPQAQAPTDAPALNPLPAAATPLPTSQADGLGSSQALTQQLRQPGGADPRRADKGGAASASSLTAASTGAGTSGTTTALAPDSGTPSRIKALESDGADASETPGAAWPPQQPLAAPQDTAGAASPNPPASQSAPAGTSTAWLAPQVGSHEWGKALGKHLAHMSSGSGQQTAELQLNPPGLGPLKVTLSLNEHQVQAMFVSAHPQVRSAVEAALPELRTLLADSGISLGQTSVGAESQPQSAFSQAQGDAPQQRSPARAPVIENAAGAPAPAPAERATQDRRISLYA